MPRTGKENWGDILVRAFMRLGGQATLPQLYAELERMPEAREKIKCCRARKPDIQSQLRCLISARDSRFVRTDKRGVWRLGDKTKEPPRKSVGRPNRYGERIIEILTLMHIEEETIGCNAWTQRYLTKPLRIDINCLNKVVLRMVKDNILERVAGSGRTYDPWAYAPAKGAFEMFGIVKGTKEGRKATTPTPIDELLKELEQVWATKEE